MPAAVSQRFVLGDTIIGVDGVALDGRGLASVMRPSSTHTFEVERWPESSNPTSSSSVVVSKAGWYGHSYRMSLQQSSLSLPS